MRIDSLILIVVSLLFIFSACKQLQFSKNLSIYNLSITGLVCSFTLVIFYQISASRLLLFLLKIPLLGGFIARNPSIFLQSIVILITLFGLTFIALHFRVIWLSWRFEVLVKEHRYRAALRLAEKRLKFLYIFYGRHYLTASMLGGLAGFYIGMGERAKAKKLFIEAINIFRKSYFIRSENKSALEVRVKLSLRLSELYLSEGSYSKAEANCRQLIESKNKNRIESILLVQAIQIIALSRGFQGDFRGFSIQSAEAKKIYKAWVKKEGRFHKLRRNLKSKNELLAKQFPTLILAIVFIPPIIFSFFRTYWYLGFVLVIYALTQIFDYILANLIKQNKEKEESTVQYCSLIEREGKFYEALGDYELALARYDEVLEKLSLLHDDSISKELVIAKNFQNRAVLQASAGLLKADSRETQDTYYRNAILDYEKAIERYASLQRYNSNFVPIQYANNHALCLAEKALTRVRLVGLEVAEEETKRAFSEAKALLLYPSSDYVASLIEFGFIYYWSNDYAKAKEQYRQAKEIIKNEEAGKNLNQIHLRYFGALLNIADGQTKQALEYMKDIVEESSFLLQQCLSITSETHKISAIKHSQSYLNAYITLVYRYFLKSPLIVGDLLDRVIQRKAVSTEMWMAQRDFILENSASPSLKDLTAKWRSLQEMRRQVAHQILGDSSLQNKQVQKLIRDKDVLEEALAKDFPELCIHQNLKVATRKTIASALPTNSVMIEIIKVDFINLKPVAQNNQSESSSTSNYFAFILYSGEPDDFSFINLGSAEVIDTLIAKFRRQITDPNNYNSTETARDRHFSGVSKIYSAKKGSRELMQDIVGEELRKKVFDPLYTSVKGSSNIFISPDGNLTQLPFEVLPTSNNGYLIDLYSFTYLSTGRDILRMKSKSSQKATRSVVLADPDFNYGQNLGSLSSDSDSIFQTRQFNNLNLQGITFGRLMGTEVEGRIISELLDAEIWLGTDARKKKVFDSIKSPLIFHIATHGFFLPDQPERFQENLNFSDGQLKFNSNLENPLLRSCLALAGANWKSKSFLPPRDAGNGILSAEEVSGLNLLATELVVLSACDTGLGEILVGEGVFGLRRAFTLAGASTLVMSLWQVPDKQTEELMISFYQRLLSGENRSEALRKAQLEIKSRKPHPFFWGAFICQGDPSPMFN